MMTLNTPEGTFTWDPEADVWVRFVALDAGYCSAMATTRKSQSKAAATKKAAATTAKRQRNAAVSKKAHEQATPKRNTKVGDDTPPRAPAAQDKLEDLASGDDARTEGRPANAVETKAEGVIEAEAAILGTPPREGPRVGAPVAPALGHSLDSQTETITRSDGETLDIDKITTSKRDRVKQRDAFLAGAPAS